LIFKFYIDDDEKTEDIKEKFSLVKEHLATKIDPREERRFFGY